jgi:hypothetical protein
MLVIINIFLPVGVSEDRSDFLWVMSRVCYPLHQSDLNQESTHFIPFNYMFDTSSIKY